MRAALRHAGCSVEELHETVWTSGRDKSALLGSGFALLSLAARLCRAYARLMTGILVRRKDIDVAVFGFIGQLDILVLGTLLRALGKPVLFDPLVTLTDTLVEDRARVPKQGLRARLIRLADRLAFRIADVVLADTDENRDYISSTFGMPAHRICVVPVGADESVFSSDVALQTATVSDGERRPLKVLFYGTMIPLQGVETIVRAAKLLERDCVEFEVIGSGQTLAKVRRLAEDLRVRNLTFVPSVPYDELPRRIADSDILLGIFGGTAKAGRVVPNKVYQAMAMGAAIITRDSSASHRLLRTGESAILIPPADYTALADAIRALRDPDLRLRLGEAARRRFVETSTVDVQSDLVRKAIDLAMTGPFAGNHTVTA